RLSPEHKKFILHHMERIQKNEYVQLDFEEAIASIEQVHDSLDSYVNFLLHEEEGRKFLESENLTVEELQNHLTKIKEIIITYTASIVEIIDGNVHWEQIGDRLSGFINWLQNELLSEDEFDLFTLNFDLLLETILLRIIGTEEFTDFHVKRGKSIKNMINLTLIHNSLFLIMVIEEYDYTIYMVHFHHLRGFLMEGFLN